MRFVAKMLVTWFVVLVSKCEMWSRNAISDFFFVKISFVNSFSWSCLIISSSDFLIAQFRFLANDACLFSIIEWRMFVLDLSSDVYDEMSSLTRRLIKFDENDSSNLTKATHQTLMKKRHFIKFDEKIISSNLSSSFHQTFWEERQFLYFLMRDLMQRRVIWET
jgi:hypothetical protein